jgi:hypothetical protein
LKKAVINGKKNAPGLKPKSNNSIIEFAFWKKVKGNLKMK